MTSRGRKNFANAGGSTSRVTIVGGSGRPSSALEWACHSATVVGARHELMAVWGGFVVNPMHTSDDGTPQPGWDERCSNELCLLDVLHLRWSLPAVRYVPPSPRGGHSATAVGSSVIVYESSHFISR